MSGIDMVFRGGPQVQADGAPGMGRIGKESALVVAPAYGQYYEASSRGRVFSAANQAAQAVSVALATTYTGLVLANPLGSNVNLALLKVGLALSVAPAAIATLGLIGGYSSTTDVTHTTPLTPMGLLLSVTTGVAKVDSAATIPTPKWIMQLMGGFTAAALPSSSPTLFDIDGAIVVPPGGFIAVGALTAVTGLWSMAWEEVPR